MKKTITVVVWLNRILIATFIVLITIGFTINDEMQIVALLSTIIIGPFQVFASLISLMFWKKIKRNINIGLITYIGFVLLYPVVFYVIDNFSVLINFNEVNILIPLAILLALLITFLLEVIKNSFKIK